MLCVAVHPKKMDAKSSSSSSSSVFLFPLRSALLWRTGGEGFATVVVR